MDYTQFGAWLGASGLLSVFIFFSVISAVFLGRFVGHHSHQQSKGARNSTDDTLISAILGLMALVLAFTFSGAAGRMDQRERLIAAETSAISSAYAALRYISADDQNTIRPLFRQLASERAVLFENVTDAEIFPDRQKKLMPPSIKFKMPHILHL